MHRIMWEGEPHPEHETLIREEIDGLLDRGLGRASDLIFHSIWLDDDPYGRTILLSGKEGDITETYYAEYIEKPNIVSADQISD